MLVRSWNVYHGRSDPAGRYTHVERAVRLASADRPDVLCLQELPPWALRRLAEWSGMLVFGDVTRRPSIGPVPISASLGRRLTALRATTFRSAFSGQAHAILVQPELRPRRAGVFPLNPGAFRLRFRSGLVRRERRIWARERRRCQTIRVALPDGRPAIVANLHATCEARCAERELERVTDLLGLLTRPDEVVVLAGDFNVTPAGSGAFEALARQGFSPPGRSIDHVLVRGSDVSPLSAWPSIRRRRCGVVLSDHAPVELAILPTVPRERELRPDRVPLGAGAGSAS